MLCECVLPKICQLTYFLLSYVRSFKKYLLFRLKLLSLRCILKSPNTKSQKKTISSVVLYGCEIRFVYERGPTLQVLENKVRKKCLGLIGLNCCGVLYDGSYPVAARSKAWDCGLSLAGFVGSNPIGGIDICLVSVVCCQVGVSASG